MTDSGASKDRWILEARDRLPDLENELIMLEACVDHDGESYLRRARELVRKLRSGAERAGCRHVDSLYDGIERVLVTLTARKSPIDAKTADTLLKSVDTLKGIVLETQGALDPAPQVAALARLLKAKLS